MIYLPLALSLVFVGLSGLVCRRTSPRPAAWSVTAAMMLLAFSTVGAVALLAWPLAARLPLVAHVGGWRPGAVNQGVPVPEWLSVFAVLALAVITVLVVRYLRSVGDGLIEIARMHADLGPTGAEAVAVVHDPRPSAHALPRTIRHRGVVVVSTGLLDALDAEEWAAVVAHEHAHLAHAHRLFLIVAGLAAAMNPLVSLGRHDLAFVLERWADEDAAVRTSRMVTARALAKAALAKLSIVNERIAAGSARSATRVMVMELGSLGVPQRVAALLHPETDRRRTGLAWFVAGLALVAVAAIAWATRDTEHAFELLRAH